MNDLDRANAAMDGMVFLKIEHSVGKGGRNRYADVQLIQFLLNVIHLDPGSSFRMPAVLVIDGICGQRTLSAILAYQQNKIREFPLAAADGVVTATRHALFTNPRSFGYSTIMSLNWDYMLALPRTNLAYAFMGQAAEPLLSTVIVPLQKAGVL